MTDKRKSNFDFKSFRGINIVLEFGITVLTNVGVATFIGYLIVKAFDIHRGWLIPFLILGILSGLYNGIRYLMKEADRLERDSKDGKKRDSGDNDTGSSGSSDSSSNES